VLKSAESAIVVADLSKSYGRIVAVDRVSFAVRTRHDDGAPGRQWRRQDDDDFDAARAPHAHGGPGDGARRRDASERHRVLPRMNFTSPYVDLPKRLTVGENLAVFADLYGVRRPRERIDAVATDCDVAGLLKRPYGSLSAGQRTRVSLAKAVLNEPDVLLLDEPTASLDPDIGDRMRTYLERYQHRTGCTMLLASHHMGEVERMCDDVIMLRAGVVVDQGSPRELIERYGRGTMEEVFLDVARGRADARIAGTAEESHA
jgi:ABC-2 type transport system ATP-binding protein